MLLALLLAAGIAALPDVYDLGVFKAALLGCGAVLLLPFVAWRARDGVATWFGSVGGRLVTLALLLAALGSLEELTRASVVDRLLVFVLGSAAAVLGSRASASTLVLSLLLPALANAVVVLLQALGLERSLTPGPEELVGLMGNSTRAGALLALGLAAAAAALTSSRRAWLLAALALLAAALLLTRARAALGAAGLALLLIVVVARGRALLPLAAALVVGALLAAVIAGPGRLLESKLPTEAAGEDLTLDVRLSLWRATWDMSRDHPWLGVGLGRFAERFPPYREPEEAALPGLAGATTFAEHPHSEPLLTLAEGGILGAAALLLGLAATLVVAWRRDSRVALAVLVTGVVVALFQDAWASAGTALPFFAAAGAAWRKPPHAHPHGHDFEELHEVLRKAPSRPTPRLAAIALALLLGASVTALAWPRLAVQLRLRDFLLAARATGVTLQSFPLLIRAAEADPTDVEAQRLLVHYGEAVLAAAPGLDPTPVERARQRVAELAPFGP